MTMGLVVSCPKVGGSMYVLVVKHIMHVRCLKEAYCKLSLCMLTASACLLEKLCEVLESQFDHSMSLSFMATLVKIKHCFF